MEVRAASGQINVAQLMSARSSSGRITVPVSRAQSPYAQFKYVQGIPTTNKGRALPMNRLRVLNNLIDSLVTKKETAATSPNLSRLSNKAIDALIDQFAGELHNAVSAPAVPYAGSLGYSSGSLFSMTA